MTNPEFFTLVGDFRGFVADFAGDGDYTPEQVNISATVTITPLLDGIVRATNASPRPISYLAAPTVAIIDPADGRLKLRAAGEAGNPDGFTYTPVKLLANTALLELDPATPLFYRVTFTSVSFNGVRGAIAGFDFEAPTSGDVTVNLVELAPQTGLIANGVTKIAPGGVRLDGDNIRFTFGGVDLNDPIPKSVFVGATGATGPVGATGAAATLALGSVTTGDPGSTASAVNVGSSGAAVLNLIIPRGATGSTGPRGSTGDRGEQGIQGIQGVQGQAGVSLDINGTLANYAAITAISAPAAGDAYVNASDGRLYFYDGTSWPADGAGVPFVGPIGPQGIQGAQGSAATVSVGSVSATGPGSSPSVTNVGTSNDAVLDFVLVTGATGSTGSVGATGATGAAATIAVGTVTSGSTASVTNSGSSGAAVLDFVLERGATGATGSVGATGGKGDKGDTGDAATISVGTVTTGAAGSSASVTNVGTSGAAVFNITIPRGDTGSASGVTWDTLDGKPAYIGAGASQAAARAAIGAGTSDLVIGTTSTTAKAGDYTPAAADISDSTNVGRDVLKAATQADARTAIGAGTSSLALGTTSSTAKAGDYTPTSSEITTSLGYTPENPANKNQNNGYAGLSSSGLVDPSVLPSYVDDVLEYANLAGFPGTGVSGKIYIAADTGRSYRWSGSLYAEIIASPGTTDAITEGATNLFFTNGRADDRADGRITAAIGSTVQAQIATGTTGQYYRGDKTWATLNAAAVSGAVASGGALGTPSSGTLTNCTGLPVGGISATGISSTAYLRGDGTWSTISTGMNRNVSTVTTDNTTLSAATNTDYVVFANITGTAGDTSFSSVTALLHFDGADNGTTLTDSSSLASNWTVASGAKLSTATKKFGTASLSLAGGSDRITSTAATSNFAFGTSGFTIEAWIYPNTVSVAQNIMSLGDSISTPAIYMSGTSLNMYLGSDRITGTGAIPSSGAWYHIALCRSGTSTKLFVNGTQVGSTYSDTNNYGSAAVLIGNANNAFNGFIDDFRITRAARYTSNFTAPTAAFPEGLIATMTLPSTASTGTNLYSISNIHASDLLSVATTSAQTVNGSASATLTPGTKLTVVSDGSNWRSPW